MCCFQVSYITSKLQWQCCLCCLQGRSRSWRTSSWFRRFSKGLDLCSEEFRLKTNKFFWLDRKHATHNKCYMVETVLQKHLWQHCTDYLRVLSQIKELIGSVTISLLHKEETKQTFSNLVVNPVLWTVAYHLKTGKNLGQI